jgi:lipid-A-disaccharide synthase
MLGAWRQLRAARPGLRARMVLPKEELMSLARGFGSLDGIELQLGNLPGALRAATIAMASTGTVTMECAWFGVPTVAFYKTSWSTYQVGKRIVTVPSLTMPNLLAGETVFPEFVQHDATAENLARAAGELLDSPERRQRIRVRLGEIVATLGPPGAARRAARCIAELIFNPPTR